jgi:hypothetical protein
VSVTVTVRASPEPLFFAVITNPIWSPAETVAASAVFVRPMLPQLTVVDALACAAPSLLVDTDALLLIVAQLADVVGDVMCTDLLCPLVSVPQVQVSTDPAIEHPASEPAAIDQFRPPLVGRVSVTVTVRASPEPLFFAVMTNPIGSPALTVAASAVFVRPMSPQLTTV